MKARLLQGRGSEVAAFHNLFFSVRGSAHVNVCWAFGELAGSFSFHFNRLSLVALFARDDAFIEQGIQSRLGCFRLSKLRASRQIVKLVCNRCQEQFLSSIRVS